MKSSRPESSRREQVLAQHRRRPTDPYWCLRLCEEVRPSDGRNFATLWTNALARVASYDPTWFVGLNSASMGALGVLRVSPAVLTRVEKLLSIRDRSLDHYVKGVLWAQALRYESPPPVDLLRHAADHLLCVEERHRTDHYFEEVCHALEHVDYVRMKAFFGPLLGLSPTGHSQRSQLASAFVIQGRLVFVLVASARARDWETYDTYRERYREGDNPHRDCKIASCDGLRELAHGRDEHVADILKYLTERGANVQFLGVKDDTAFVEALIKRGRFRDECRSYLEMTRTSTGPRPPSDRVDKLLARLARGQNPARRKSRRLTGR